MTKQWIRTSLASLALPDEKNTTKKMKPQYKFTIQRSIRLDLELVIAKQCNK